MNWYSGNIAEAIALSKSKNAIFVVYLEGKDESSQRITGFINDEKIRSKLESEKFVAIKIEGGSVAYMQFAQIYQLVPLPSIFFIGKNGTPLEIVTSVVSSVDELNEKIEKSLKLAGLSDNNITPSTSSALPLNSQDLASASTSFITNEQNSVEKNETPSTSNIVCDGDVCYRKTETVEANQIKQEEACEDVKPKQQIEQKTQEKSEKDTISSPPQVQTIQNKVDHAKKLMEEKRRERDLEEARLEREREIKRRKEGQEMQNLKNWQKDQEYNQQLEKIQREKLEEQAARQRILEQIAADRAERAKRMNYSNNNASTSQQNTEQRPSTSKQASKLENTSTYARIQFKKPTGDSETHNFLPSDQFKIVRDFVKSDLLNGKIKEFSLATTFPRREFTLEDDTKTLKELDLYPSSVLLVLVPTITSAPSAIVARSGGFINTFNMVFWAMLSPIFYVYNFVRGFFSGQRPRQDGGNAASSGQKRSNSENPTSEASKKRNIARFQTNELIDDSSVLSSSSTSRINLKDKSAPYKRISNSNVHRLRDQKDSDDENNTWNGNSTQQQ